MHNLIVPNNIVYNNLLAAVRTGREQTSKLPSGQKIRFKLTAGICPEFSEFDFAVYAYMCGIWADKENPGNTFSITSLCRSLGCSASGGISPVIRQEVTQSIERLCDIRIGMDTEADFNQHRKFLGDLNLTWEAATGVRWKSANPLICLETEEKTLGNADSASAKTETIYQITAEPLLYTYSRVTDQFVTIPTDRFQIHDLDADGRPLLATLAMTKNRISEVFWLARRLEHIRYNSEHSRKKKKGMWAPKGAAKDTILLSTTFERIGLDKRSASRHKGQHLKFLMAVLGCWHAQGIIPDWHVRKNMLGNEDAFVFNPSPTFSKGARAVVPEPAPCNYIVSPNIAAPKGLPAANFGADIASFGAPYANFGAGFTASECQKTAQLSWFDALVDAVAGRLKYPKYFKTVSPACP